MPSRNKIRVAQKLIASLEVEGYTPNCHAQRAVSYVAEKIWTASGGATKLDVARWGVDVPCLLTEPPENDFYKGNLVVPVSVGSWLTLAQAAKGGNLPLIRHSHRSFEA